MELWGQVTAWPVPKNRFLRAPPQQILVEKIKKIKKLKTTKEKKLSYPTSPVVSSYNFFDKIYTLASPGIQTAYLQPRANLPYHYITQALVTL